MLANTVLLLMWARHVKPDCDGMITQNKQESSFSNRILNAEVMDSVTEEDTKVRRKDG